MKKYRCTNCDYRWEAQDEPFECPKCHSASIESGGGGGSFVDAMKKFWWLIVCGVAVAAVAVFLMIPRTSTRVSVNADTENGTMTVKLSGKHAGEYVIMLNDGERRFATSPDSTEVFWDNLTGEYTLSLVYMGTGEAPKVHEFESHYTFASMFERIAEEMEEETGVNQEVDNSKVGRLSDKPSISTVKLVAQGGEYTATVVLGNHGCTVQEAEFSIDGQEWVKSNVFRNLKPGEYRFYARNASNPALTHDVAYNLEQPVDNRCISAADVNSFLTKMENKMEYSKVRDALYKKISRGTKVEGNPDIADLQDLVNDPERSSWTVTAVNCVNGKVVSLTIAKK